jgi:hypothetical protein
MSLMRLRRPASGPEHGSMVIASANSIFNRRVGEATTPEDQKYALRMANQLSYNNATYDYLGKNEGPRFYGYSGVGVTTGGKTTKMEVKQYTMAIWVVPAGQPTQKVTYVNSKGEPELPTAANELQGFFDAVPMPEVSKIPAGGLIPQEGTDGFVCIWQPSTNRLWEIWRLGVEGEEVYEASNIWSRWEEGKGYEGKYTLRFGGFIEGVSSWNGICPFKWGAMATSLGMHGGLFTLQDLVDVLLGKPIKHALAVVVPDTAGGLGPIAPALRVDSPVEVNKVPELNGKGEPNPAYGKDGVNESMWFRFPPGANASTYGITKPLETAIFNCIRDYGTFISNGGAAPNFFAEWPGNLGSPYAWPNVNPLAGAPASIGSFPWMPSSLTSSVVPTLTEEVAGSASCFTKQPWQILEQITPFSS